MHIALVTDGIYPYVIGGMQRHSFYLAKYLAAAGVQVDLYHTNQSELDISKLEFFSEKEQQNIRSFVIEFPQFGQTPGHYIRESYEYSMRIWNIYKKEKRPDFIIVKGFAGWELLNQKSKGESLPPVGINFHGYEMFQPQPGFISWVKSRLILRSPVLFNVKNADYLFSYGGKITELILQLGISKNRIIEIPTGISSDWLPENPNPSLKIRKFIFCGRYERRKGVEELGKVLRKLIQEKKEFEFHFIGPIPKNKQISSDKIIYHGQVSDDVKMKNLLRQMDVLVCPSHSEGMPNVILEAMASGLAVIASDVGATSVIVKKANGWLVAPANISDLFNAIEEARTMPAVQLDEKKQAAINAVKNNFLWDKIIKETIFAIEEKLK